MIEVIKFGADWCGPCRMVAPTVEKLKAKYNVEGSDVQITSIDVDQSPEFSREHKIQSIPAFVIRKDGITVAKKIGVLTQDQLEEEINKLQTSKIDE
jgi:thioredoxin 1